MKGNLKLCNNDKIKENHNRCLNAFEPKRPKLHNKSFSLLPVPWIMRPVWLHAPYHPTMSFCTCRIICCSYTLWQNTTSDTRLNPYQWCEKFASLNLYYWCEPLHCDANFHISNDHICDTFYQNTSPMTHHWWHVLAKRISNVLDWYLTDLAFGPDRALNPRHDRGRPTSLWLVGPRRAALYTGGAI